MSYELKIDPKKRAASRFIGKVRKALVSAAIDEKSLSGINQQKVAASLGVNRSVINRMLKGDGNLTLRSIGELAWALGWEPEFTMKRRAEPKAATNTPPVEQPAVRFSAGSTKQNVTVYPAQSPRNASSYVEAAE
ncbi:hypothetical protein GCM10010520_67310 [Rhizobium viscosum]|uniref:Plasmid maintenance system antidote protein VapI n=1 Tax=Rhizobium viscosum TaxID=1673 RepID=A0ABR9IV73_RHIVS|nr:helix-turn-helix transcriptional regulator [Rhizobium viscosum]MBE1506707.1 plasmid maintenance system antidote protein VapI [Rhizobium viscosum]